MNTEYKTKNDATGISRRAMLGKTAKYAALIPAASLIATKANAHTGYLGGSAASTQDCIDEHAGLSFTVQPGHCVGNHGTAP